ncbi:uncharacterized protein N7482_005377 [Penicillium canariense]|uniref:Rhodopsin domain-containing protein n=1 Tax=Penicillium canariense TaxID=189055 RepID=A0A9W9I2D3_9EURO|nr:uncharacterized protein N7482_005377 [Penicillium canariense]KAJ5166596.1 hypothetical protein N7482_005377 [Penicillium canariense]
MGEARWVDSKTPFSDGGVALITVSVVLSVVQMVFVAARFYTRYMQRMRCGLDDYVMLIALAGSLAKAIIYIVLVHIAGLGYHLDEVTHPEQKVALIRKFFFVLEILDLPLCITPAKISLLLFYMRIFHVRKFRIFTYLVGSLVLAIGITVFFQTIFQCSPISYGWDLSAGHGKCIDQTTFYRYISPFNVLTGILILAMPLPLVWKLQAPKEEKFALTIVFLLGGLGSVVSILRMVKYMQNSPTQLSDVTWFSINLGIPTVVEGAVIIIASCLVTIWPLVIRLTPRRLRAALSSSFSRTPEHHTVWYNTAQFDTQRSAVLTPSEANSNRTDSKSSWYGSHCSFEDLEDQRWWDFEERDTICDSSISAI